MQCYYYILYHISSLSENHKDSLLHLRMHRILYYAPYYRDKVRKYILQFPFFPDILSHWKASEILYQTIMLLKHRLRQPARERTRQQPQQMPLL